MTLKNIKILSSLSAGVLLLSASHAQTWQVVDTFDNGEPQAAWAVGQNLITDFSEDHLYLRTEDPLSTRTLTVPLPQAVSTGKVTIYLDMNLPAGPVQNQIGFGVGSADQAATTGWGPTGTRNRFQTANPFPQNLVKAGDWGTDLLDPTLQAVWYNIWVVYDLDAQEFTFYQRRADSATLDAIEMKTFPFWGTLPEHNDTNDDLSTISHFALGAGPLEAAVEGFSALGGRFDNIYMAVGENLTLPDTAVVVEPPSWEAVDILSPSAWSGDVDDFAVDFSEGYVDLVATASTNRSNVYVELPQTMAGGRFTVTFDLYVPGTPSDRNDLGLAVVGDAQINLSGWDQRGGGDRLATLGAPPQNFVKANAPTSALIPGAELQGNWFHIWLYYDLAANTLSFYHTPFGGEVPAVEAPTATWVLSNSYTNFRYFIAGLDRSTNPGLGVGNLYFASDELITLSPTAGEFTPGGGEKELPPLGLNDDATLGLFEHFGDFVAHWMGAFEGNRLGFVYLGALADDNTGWLYHYELAEWLWVAPIDGASLQSGSLYLYSLESGWIETSAETANSFVLLAEPELLYPWRP